MDPDMQEAERLFQESMASYRRGTKMLAQVREYLRHQQTEDETPLSLERAVCHPILGGILRVDPAADVPGPTFTVASLRRAIAKGDLACVTHGRLQFVTPAALKAWISRGGSGGVRPKPGPAPIDYRPPAQQTKYEKTLEEAAMDRAADAFAAVDQMVARKKTKKRSR